MKKTPSTIDAAVVSRLLLGVTLALSCGLAACNGGTNFGDFDVTPLPDGGAGDVADDAATDVNEPDASDDGGVDDSGTGDGTDSDAVDTDGEGPDGVDPDAADLCGNGVRDAGELCDGEDVGASGCGDFGFGGGALLCVATCDAFDFSACEAGPVCGDNVRDTGELCDGTDVGAASCTDFAFASGTLGCAEGCDGYDFTGCENGGGDPICGNDTREAGELCDGTDVGAASCVDFAFDRGTLSCAEGCANYDFSACERDGGGDPVCGNSLLETGEVCDGTALGGASCVTAGFDRGTLACAGDCSRLDTSLCVTDGCVPNCGGRECGLDPVCGVSCGACGGGETCDAAGQCIAPGDSGPRFITFNTNVVRITQGETVRFTAVVTDPDGIDDLIGGTLRDPVSGATYGSFTTSAAEGSYQIELSWEDIHFVRDIDFEVERVRTFEAEFFDTAASRSTRSIDVTLFCEDGLAPAACDGQCVDFGSTSDCGGCDVACASRGFCAAVGATYECSCDIDEAVCSGTCTDITTTSDCGGCDVTCRGDQLCGDGACECSAGFTECGGACESAFNTGTCGPSCLSCGETEWCDGAACQLTAQGDVRIDAATNTVQLYNASSWRPICDDGFGAEEGAVLCRMMGGTYISHRTNQSSGTSSYWLDDLQCTGDEDDVLDCPGDELGDEDCSGSEGVSLVCEFAGGIDRDCLPYGPGEIVVNEFQTFVADGTPEFVEIKAAPGADLSGVTLEFVNFLGFTDQWVLDFGATADAGGHFFAAYQADADQRFDVDSPVPTNGAIRVLDCEGNVLDAVGYGDTVGEGTPLPPQGLSDTYGRVPDGFDSNDNADDFRLVEPTPGFANGDGAGGDYSFEGLIFTSDEQFNRPDIECGATSNLRRYGTLTLPNPGRDLNVRVTATHTAFDGWLVVYANSFSDSNPTVNCLASDDDFIDTDQSQVDVTWPNGEPLVIVLTSYNAEPVGRSANIQIDEIP